MPEIDHDWDNIIPKYKPKTCLKDKIVLTFIYVVVLVCTSLMFFNLIELYNSI